MALNRKQLSFCQEYAIDKNAARSARDAGYSPHTADSKGCQLLRLIKVKDEVDRLLAINANKAQLSALNIIKSIQDTIARCSKAGDEFDPANVLRGNELLGRHLKMFTDKLVVTNDYQAMTDDELARQLASTEQEDKSINDDVEVH